MPEGEKYTVVGGRGVIVREAPAMDSYVVGELRKGTTVWIDGGRAIDGGAYRAHMVAPLEGYVTLKATLLERCPEAPAVAQGRQRAAAAEAAQKRAAAAAERAAAERAAERAAAKLAKERERAALLEAAAAPPAAAPKRRPAEAEPVAVPPLTAAAEAAFVAVFSRYRRDVLEAGDLDASRACDVLTRRFKASYARHLFETPASPEDAACEALDEMDAFVEDRRERRLARRRAARDAADAEQRRRSDGREAAAREKRAAEDERRRTLLSLRDDRDDRKVKRQVKKGPLSAPGAADAVLAAERERQDELRKRAARLARKPRRREEEGKDDGRSILQPAWVDERL